MLTEQDYRELCRKACDMLNSAFRADPRALYALHCNRIPCTDALAEHPNVVVEKIQVLPENTPGYPEFHVGMIGVIVGMFQAMGFPCTIASMWSEPDEDGHRLFTGFSIVDFTNMQPIPDNRIT